MHRRKVATYPGDLIPAKTLDYATPVMRPASASSMLELMAFFDELVTAAPECYSYARCAPIYCLEFKMGATCNSC
jgi:hypothetical protein